MTHDAEKVALRPLDYAVARIIGDTYAAADNCWKSADSCDISCADGGPRSYSTCLAAAHAALDLLPADKDGCNSWYWRLESRPLGYGMELWQASADDWRRALIRVVVEAPTAAEAICQAIVKTTEGVECE